MAVAFSEGERMEKSSHSEGYPRLLAFLDQKMSMSHIYQPVIGCQFEPASWRGTAMATAR
ncbi:hypothetical protein CK230_27035 [Mesorhizobium sp. WSM3859]|nr:hypothetical protein CK230_27035 [Mesorhizobium sp. WSM3859]